MLGKGTTNNASRSQIAQLSIKRKHSESLLQDLLKLILVKHQLMTGSYILSSTKVQAEAMKYGLDMKTMVVKELRNYQALK